MAVLVCVQWLEQVHDVTEVLGPSDLVLGDLWLALASRSVPNFVTHDGPIIPDSMREYNWAFVRVFGECMNRAEHY